MLKFAFRLVVVFFIVVVAVGVYIRIETYEAPPQKATADVCREITEGSSVIENLPSGKWWLPLNDQFDATYSPQGGGEVFDVIKHTIYPITSGGDLQSDSEKIGFQQYYRICDTESFTCGWVTAKYGCRIEKTIKVRP